MARWPGSRRGRSGLNTSATQPLAPALEGVETAIDDVGSLDMVPDAEQTSLVVELVVELERSLFRRHVAQNRASTRDPACLGAPRGPSRLHASPPTPRPPRGPATSTAARTRP